MTEPTQPPSCSGCPLYGKSRGFAVGCGDPTTAKYAIVLEALGKDEPSFILKSNPSRKFLSTTEECEHELAIRKRDYPDLDVKWLRMGVPIVGATGAVLQWWIWNKLGMKREEMFIDNTLRCLPVKGKNGEAYPTGEDRKEAELHCRQYDRLDKYFYANSLKEKNLRVLQEGFRHHLQPLETEKREDTERLALQTKVLFPKLLGKIDHKCESALARGDEKSGAAERREEKGREPSAVLGIMGTESPKLAEQICSGTSTCDGEGVGSISQVHGSGASSERDQDGQSARKLGDRQDGTSGQSSVSALRERVQYQVAIASLHPASILREITPLPLLVKDFEKLRDFTQQGHRCLMLLGGKAVHAFLRYGSNVTKWRGTYQALPLDWPDMYKSDFVYTRKRKREPKVMMEGVCGKKHKGKKAAPKCGYIGCVEDFQRRINETQS